MAIKGGLKSTAGEFDGGGKNDFLNIGVGVGVGDGDGDGDGAHWGG